MVMAAYAYYKAGKYDEAVCAADRYLTLHPGTPESDLAQNIIAMSYYDQVLDPKRDQTNARKSLAGLSHAAAALSRIRAMPAEAQNRARILRDLLAANEMAVGRYYLRHNNYPRGDQPLPRVVTDYQTTAQVEEALSRLTEAYIALRHHSRGPNGRRGARPQLPGQQVVPALLTRCCRKHGLKPQAHEGSWITQTWKGDGKPA